VLVYEVDLLAVGGDHLVTIRRILPRSREVSLRKAATAELLNGDDGNSALDEVRPIEEALALLEGCLGYRFINQELLEAALTHRSLQQAESVQHYERLEFLGDAVLDLAIAALLIKRHPEASEGELSKMRAALVSTKSLAELARSIELGAHVRLSRGERLSGGDERPSILADVVEAVMGALLEEQGFDRSVSCIERLFSARLDNVLPSDPKTELQELLHATSKNHPSYQLLAIEGPQHEAVFVSSVNVGDEILGIGRGGSKKLSQQAAAAEALRRVRSTQHLKAKEEEENGQ
jgi:ribonuclease-3